MDELPAGITGEFDDELEALDLVSGYLKELAIRIDESVWGSKRLLLPEEVTNELNEIIERGSEQDEI